DTANPSQGWVQLAPLLTARQGHSACVIGAVIYVIGGADHHGSILNNIETYDTGAVNPVWTPLATTLHIPRFHGSANVVGTKIYVMGGNNDTGILDSVELFDTAVPESGWKLLLNVAAIPIANHYLRSVLIGDKIYVLGSSYTHHEQPS